MKVEAIVVAAGSGRRLKRKISKALVKVLNLPIIIHTLKKFSLHPLINSIILVCRKEDIANIYSLVRKHNIKKIKLLCAGGERRIDSVYNGISCLDKNTDIVIIHDGARPLIERKIITKCIKKANSMGACVVGVPVKSTIKEVSNSTNLIKKTLDRNLLYSIQTPQVFKTSIIKKAFEKKARFNATDDSLLVEMINKKVALVEGSYSNIKITTPEDIFLAERLFNKMN